MMTLHLDEEGFKTILLKMHEKSNIDTDLLEKDYYVCCFLKELATKQDEIKAYFKGGTAIYKILDSMNRFSEDIDLTVKVLDSESKGQNQRRLKKSVFDYNIDGVQLLKDETIDRKGSITAKYEYKTTSKTDVALQRAGVVQIESTSFTVSEPYNVYTIEPLIYRYADEKDKEILSKNFGVNPFKIKIITLERMFIDKIFAVEFYYIRNMFTDMSKHLYDITTLFDNEQIQNMLNDKEKVQKLIDYKRDEEANRAGGIDSELKISDFKYLNCDFNEEVINAFKGMQDKYVYDEKYKIEIDQVKEKLQKIKKIAEKYNV